MKQITDRDEDPSVFRLSRNGDDLWLNDSGARPDDEWAEGNRFVFRFRKLES